MNGSKTEALKYVLCPIKHCPWVGIHGGIRNEQSGESPVRAQQGGESAKDPDSRWGVRRRGSVGLIKEKWLVSCAEETSSGRQNREDLAQAPCSYGSECSTWGTMSRWSRRGRNLKTGGNWNGPLASRWRTQMREVSILDLIHRTMESCAGTLTCKGTGDGQRIKHSDGEYLGGDGEGMFH